MKKLPLAGGAGATFSRARSLPPSGGSFFKHEAHTKEFQVIPKPEDLRRRLYVLALAGVRVWFAYAPRRGYAYRPREPFQCSGGPKAFRLRPAALGYV